MEYRDYMIERIIARRKDIKAVAEQTLEGENLLGMYLIGDILDSSRFDDTSDVEIVFHIDGDGEEDPYMSDQLTIEIELAGIPDVENIKAVVQYYVPTDLKLSL